MRKVLIALSLVALFAGSTIVMAATETKTNRLGQTYTVTTGDDGVTTSAFSFPNDPSATLEYATEAPVVVARDVILTNATLTLYDAPYAAVYHVDASAGTTGAYINLDNADTNVLSQPLGFEITFINVGVSNNVTFQDVTTNVPLANLALANANTALAQWDVLSIRKVASNQWVQTEYSNN